MSAVRLLVSGLLVASGLVLAAFTLHGAFDGGQVQASVGGAPQPWSTNAFGAGGRLIAASAAAGSEAGKAPPPQTVPKPDAKAVKKKRPPEQAQKSKQPPQQAAFQWPWTSWFGN